jgi:hypothetical protein
LYKQFCLLHKTISLQNIFLRSNVYKISVFSKNILIFYAINTSVHLSIKRRYPTHQRDKATGRPVAMLKYNRWFVSIMHLVLFMLRHTTRIKNTSTTHIRRSDHLHNNIDCSTFTATIIEDWANFALLPQHTAKGTSYKLKKKQNLKKEQFTY